MRSAKAGSAVSVICTCLTPLLGLSVPLQPPVSARTTSDVAGLEKAGQMRQGDAFYLQLFADTRGFGMTSFEVQLVEDPGVCQFVPYQTVNKTASYDSYTGPLEGELSGTFYVEVLRRMKNPTDATQFFTKYSRLQRLEPLNDAHGHIGYVKLIAISSGTCLKSASLTAFFHSGGTARIPGAAMNEQLRLVDNILNIADVNGLGL